MSIIIDDLYTTAEFHVGIFRSILENKIWSLFSKNIPCIEEVSITEQQLIEVIESAYTQSLNFIYAEIYALRNPLKWDPPHRKKIEEDK